MSEKSQKIEIKYFFPENRNDNLIFNNIERIDPTIMPYIKNIIIDTNPLTNFCKLNIEILKSEVYNEDNKYLLALINNYPVTVCIFSTDMKYKCVEVKILCNHKSQAPGMGKKLLMELCNQVSNSKYYNRILIYSLPNTINYYENMGFVQIQKNIMEKYFGDKNDQNNNNIKINLQSKLIHNVNKKNFKGISDINKSYACKSCYNYYLDKEIIYDIQVVLFSSKKNIQSNFQGFISSLCNDFIIRFLNKDDDNTFLGIKIYGTDQFIYKLYLSENRNVNSLCTKAIFVNEIYSIKDNYHMDDNFQILKYLISILSFHIYINNHFNTLCINFNEEIKFKSFFEKYDFMINANIASKKIDSLNDCGLHPKTITEINKHIKYISEMLHEENKCEYYDDYYETGFEDKWIRDNYIIHTNELYIIKIVLMEKNDNTDNFSFNHFINLLKNDNYISNYECECEYNTLCIVLEKVEHNESFLFLYKISFQSIEKDRICITNIKINEHFKTIDPQMEFLKILFGVLYFHIFSCVYYKYLTFILSSNIYSPVSNIIRTYNFKVIKNSSSGSKIGFKEINDLKLLESILPTTKFTVSKISISEEIQKNRQKQESHNIDQNSIPKNSNPKKSNIVKRKITREDIVKKLSKSSRQNTK